MRIINTTLLFILCSATYCQDLNYWTNQFGTRSSLMGGAVVGGIKDNTAIYYNPAALAFIDSSSVSVNANLYKFENIRVANGAGDKKDLATVNIGSVPLLVGGRLRTKNPRMNVGYGIVAPIDFNFKGGARSTGFYPIANVPESPGDEEYTGQVSLNAELSETTAILGMSWKMGDNWSLGLSNLIMVRSHAYTEATIGRMFLNDATRTLVAVNDLENVRYTHIAYTPRLGINLLAGKWAWGAVVTTPALRLYSTASVTADVTGNEVNLFGNGRIDITGSDAQAKLKAKYKYPLTMAVGGVRNLTKGRLGITAQYFTGIDPYSIVTPQSGQFLRPSSVFPNETTDKYLQVKTAARPVLNAAIAFERDLSEKLVLTVSFRTDFSAYNDVMKNENGIKPYITTWDIFHLAGGCTWHTGRHDLSLGLNLAAGTDNDYQQSVNLDDPTESNFLLGKLEVANARYFSAALILGYTYLFKR